MSMFSMKLSLNAKPKSQSEVAETGKSNILTNNSHLLRREKKFDTGLDQVKQLPPPIDISDIWDEPKKRKQKQKKKNKLPKILSTTHGEVYYTVYQEGAIASESQVKYRDGKGNAINPVDLMFEDTPKKSPNVLSKLGKPYKQELPCIGARELEYESRRNNKAEQLNVMPSFTSGDLIYEKPRRARTVPVTQMEPQIRRASLDTPRTLSMLSLEKELPEEPAPEQSYFSQLPTSLWGCVSYVASFIPPIPVLLEEPEPEPKTPVEEVVTKPIIDLKTKELPELPLERQASPLSSKNIRSKFHDFAYLELPQEGYNRTAHPNFIKRYGKFDKQRSVTTGKLKF